MRIKAVLFDIDGTLVDSNDFHVRAWDEAFRAAGYEFDANTLHAQIGKGGDLLVPTLLRDADEDVADKLDKAHGAIFKSRYLESVRAFPHARDLLVKVKATGRKVMLASSTSNAELDCYLALLDIRDVVSASTTIDDVQTSKPAPDIFAVALKKIGLTNPDEALVVGDAPYDADAARKCGIATVSVRSGGFEDGDLQKAGAVAIYDDVAAILADFDRSPLAK